MNDINTISLWYYSIRLKVNSNILVLCIQTAEKDVPDAS
jgi:hypothetical protein